jgi:hypothetical protein
LPRQQTFEGPRLPELLARVSAESGPGATIVDARKIRTGGIGGFFAREHFEVRVEMADGTPAPFEDLAAEPPASLLDLADLVDEEEADVTRHAIGRIPVAQVTSTVARRAFEENMASTADGGRGIGAPGPLPLPGVPERALEPVEIPPVPLPSTEGHSFRSVLRKLVSEVEPGQAAPEPVVASFEPFAAGELFVGAPGAAGIGPAAPFEAEPGPFAGHLELVEDDPHPAAADTSLTDAIMLSLGVPELPAGLGSRATIAVVGSGWPALQVAASIAQQVVGPDAGLDDRWEHDRPLHVLFPVGDDAYDTSWTGPTIVAIDAPMGGVDLSWASGVLGVLDPDMVWGVVDATRKNEDITAWCVDIGGVDVLAVENLDATCSPAAVLELGLPVGLIDRRPATRLAWASLLAERVALSA